MANKGKQEEPYIEIAYHALKIPGLGVGEKVLLGYIYSFGDEGCRLSNAALAEIFMVTERTISRRISKLVRLEHVQVESPKGLGRTIRVNSHPDVEDEAAA
jgi:hypothetical protein